MKPFRAVSLVIMAGLTALLITASPDPAWAKAGKSASMGSRGSRTSSSVAPAPSQTPQAPAGSFLQHNSSSSGSAAQPITRSTTPPPPAAVPVGPSVQSESLAPIAVPRQQVSPSAPTAVPGQAPIPSAAAPMSPRSSFMSGLAGGLIGAGIGSFMFGGGHSFFGEGTGGFLGAAIQLALLFFIGRWLIRTFLFKNRGPVAATGYRRMDMGGEPGFGGMPREPSFAPGFSAREPSLSSGMTADPVLRAVPPSAEPMLRATPVHQEPTLSNPSFGGPSVASPVAAAAPAAMAAATTQAPARPTTPRQFVLTDDDLAAIETLLINIQAAWTSGDRIALQRLATPEMAGYFSEQLTQDRARGLENRVEQVQLLKGDVNETWAEGTSEYATVTLHWSALDYTLSFNGRNPAGELVSGTPHKPVEETEVWTVLRKPNGPWTLSAIQQV